MSFPYNSSMTQFSYSCTYCSIPRGFSLGARLCEIAGSFLNSCFVTAFWGFKLKISEYILFSEDTFKINWKRSQIFKCWFYWRKKVKQRPFMNRTSTEINTALILVNPLAPKPFNKIPHFLAWCPFFDRYKVIINFHWNRWNCTFLPDVNALCYSIRLNFVCFMFWRHMLIFLFFFCYGTVFG